MGSTSFSRPGSRPVTPGKSQGTDNPPLPPIPESRPDHAPRRSSLGGFLRRSKSSELSGSQKFPGARLSRKRSAREQQELLRRQSEAGSLSASPPRLPDIYNGVPPSSIQTFGGDGARDDSSGSHRASRPPRASTDSYASHSQGPNAIPIPPIPEDSPGSRGGSYANADPYARTESMTNRGRYSYASSAISAINSPRKVRRRKDPTPFNVLVIGARSSGKSSFLSFLASSLSPQPPRGRPAPPAPEFVPAPASSPHQSYTSLYLETEIDHERIGLTLWDSPGLDASMVDLQLREMSSFLESKFEDTFTEEMKVVRAPGVQDTHIHCVFLLLDPGRLESNIRAGKRDAAGQGMNGSGQSKDPRRIVGGLDEDLDLSVLRALQGKTTVVPVISKADTVTTKQMQGLKRMVWDSLKKANLDPLEALGLDDPDGDGDIPEEDEEAAEREMAMDVDPEDSSDSSLLIGQGTTTANAKASAVPGVAPKVNAGPEITGGKSNRRHSQSLNPKEDETPYLPLSIISPDSYDAGVIGRRFPWGFADPMDESHCDFVRLKEAVFTEWRGELREASRELWYEGWRSERLRHRKG